MIEIIASGDPPQMPDYLTAEAQAVWGEEIGRIMAAGGSETDSALVGRYCSLESMVRQAFASGSPPPAAYLAELRRHAELLGIAGP
jgi:phage terminase small subunit